MLLALFLAASSLFAEEAPAPAKKADLEIKAPVIITKEHTLNLPEGPLPYESHTGTLTVKNMDGKDEASIFFVAYFADDPAKDRPLIFCFNGGPGCASIWLHMGFAGPKKVVLRDLEQTPPPGAYEENPYSLLPLADLVFVDAVSTGFSKPCEGIDPKTLHGVEEDINVCSEFIRQFVTHYGKWANPKYLLGESYGTARVVGIAERLADHYFMNVNGLILAGSALNFEALDFDNDEGMMLAVPTYAATAWYHKKLSPSLQGKKLQEVLCEVEEFCLHDYATALLAGDSLDEAQKDEIASRLSLYTSLSKEYILKSNLRIPTVHFYKEFLRQEGKIVGRFDSRYTSLDQNPVGEWPSFDPSLHFLAPSYLEALQSYLSNELGWEKNEPYLVINERVRPWNWTYQHSDQPWPKYLNMSDTLHEVMLKNPTLRIFAAEGYYDFAIPYFAQDFTFNHMLLPGDLRSRIEQHYYEAGHMFYENPTCHSIARQELEQFLKPRKSP
jgi:carboxypeptidase C (cathepsin A)